MRERWSQREELKPDTCEEKKANCGCKSAHMYSSKAQLSAHLPATGILDYFEYLHGTVLYVYCTPRKGKTLTVLECILNSRRGRGVLARRFWKYVENSDSLPRGSILQYPVETRIL